jgi:predicted nucleotidyltransferase component of viral defense system
MLNLDEILNYYPKELHKFKQFIFKEYLQYIILKIIFESKYATKLAFLGWTNLRIVHNNMRFSEDLDFDNFWLTTDEFDDLSKIVKEKLEKNWFKVEIKNVYKWAYRFNVRIPKILQTLWFSNLEQEKILIQIDTAPHDFKYKVETKVLNKFWMVFSINTTPIDIIASQKIYAIFNRNRAKWRDFFDLVFLLSKTKPNIDYLKNKLWFTNLEQTKLELLNFCDKLNFDDLASDVEVFLFNNDWKNSLKYFKEIINDSL